MRVITSRSINKINHGIAKANHAHGSRNAQLQKKVWTLQPAHDHRAWRQLPLSFENRYMFSHSARKGEDGKPISMPRNMLAGPNRSGLTKKDFLTAPSSIHAGDKYLDPEKIDYHYNQKIHGKSKLHELNFKPNSYAKTL